jgi:hypothetical protein
MTNEFRWFESKDDTRTLPKWMRRAAVGPDGTVYVPAVICGSEGDAVLSAGFDCITILRDQGHAYVPTDWVISEYPKAADLALNIQRAVRLA